MFCGLLTKILTYLWQLVMTKIDLISIIHANIQNPLYNFVAPFPYINYMKFN